MKKSLYFAPILLTTWLCSAQTVPCVKCYTNPLEMVIVESCCPFSDTISTELSKIINRRQQNFDFHYTLRKIQEPSTVSVISNWTINTMGYQKKNFLLDSDFQLPIALGGKKFGLNTVHIIPQFKFRIFQNDKKVPFGPNGDDSYPVRTPSAIPGIAYYRTFRNHWNDNEPKNLKAKILHNKYFGLFVFHHSNGQDGDEIDTKNKGEINIYNGNFGENVVLNFIIGGKVKGFKDRDHLKDNSNEQKIKNNILGKQVFLKVGNLREFYWKLSYEIHPKASTNSVFDSLGMYGMHRLNFNASLLSIPSLWELVGSGKKWCSIKPETNYEKWRFTTNINYITDKRYFRGNTYNLEKVKVQNLKRRLNLWLSAYRIIGQSKYAALFAQAGYFGSDNYNIYFNQSIWHFKFGLALAFFDQPDNNNQIK